VKLVFARLRLELHPDKTRKVDLSGGEQGFDFLGCHLNKRMSGRIRERERKRVYFLQRWPSSSTYAPGSCARGPVMPSNASGSTSCSELSDTPAKQNCRALNDHR